MSSNQAVSVTVYQNGVRCVRNGNVSSWYYPGQTRWHVREVVNPVTGFATVHTQAVDPNAVSGEEVIPVTEIPTIPTQPAEPNDGPAPG